MRLLATLKYYVYACFKTWLRMALTFDIILTLLAAGFLPAVVGTVNIALQLPFALCLLGVCFLREWLEFRPLKLPFASGDVRKYVVGMPKITGKSAQNHSHEDSARDRNLALPYANFLAKMLGMPVYVYQRSRANEAANVPGSRNFYWYRDLTCSQVDYDPPRRCVLVIIDTEYYLTKDDISCLVSSVDGPILMATLIPTVAARSLGDNGFCFQEDQSILNEISGGARFKHHLWNWSHDTMYFEYEGLKTVYDIDRILIGESGTYTLVALTPTVRYTGYPIWTSNKLMELWYRMTKGVKVLSGNTLERFCPVIKGMVYIESQRPDGRYVSLAAAGSFTSTTVPYDQFTYVMNVIKLGKVSPSIGVIASATKLDTTTASVLLNSCLQLSGAKPAYVTSGIDLKYVQYGQYDDFAKKPLHPFMSEIIPDALVFDSSRDNEAMGVKGRVINVRVDDVELDAGTFNSIVKFIDLIIPNEMKGQLMPTTLEQVKERRSRPTQRAGDRREELDVENCVNPKPFVKAEAYELGEDDKITHPRMITPAGSKSTIEYAQFVHAADEVFRGMPFVGPGNTPAALADEVVRICMLSEGIGLTDFSRLDGRVSLVARVLWSVFMMTLFHPSCHAQLSKCIRENFMQFAKTSAGIKYCTGWARWSGSMETTWANTLLTSFFAFIALLSRGYDPAEAVNMFNATGDDLVCANLTEKAALSAAKKLNLVVEYEWVPFGEIGVNYLNQFFGPGVWYGDNNSISKVDRALRKFHLAPRLTNVTPLQYAVVKAGNYLLSNPETPVLSEFCKTIVQFGDPKLVGVSTGNFFAENFGREVQWPNFRAEWQYEYIDKWLPGFNYSIFNTWRSQATAATVLFVPLCIESKYQGIARAWVNGDSTMPEVLANEPIDYEENDLYRNVEQRKRMQNIADNLVKVNLAIKDSLPATVDRLSTYLRQVTQGDMERYDFASTDEIVTQGTLPDRQIDPKERKAILDEDAPLQSPEQVALEQAESVKQASRPKFYFKADLGGNADGLTTT